MQFFIDSADISEIEQGLALGLVDGVTTNPSLIAKTGRKMNEVIKDISNICKGPISAEVTDLDFKGMLSQARKLRAIGHQIVVKIPLTLEGIQVVKICAQEGIPTNVTLCFSALQALAAAKAGATYISPFIGRLDDTGHDGISVVSEILKIYKTYQLSTKVLAASIRSLSHLQLSALAGADVATVPLKVLQAMIHHPLTTSGLEVFINDSKKIT